MQIKPMPSVNIDGAIYASLAAFQFLQIQFASDEAGKYIDLRWLFWIKTAVGCAAAALLAVKLFRSTAFADHISQKAKKESTEPTEP